MVGWNDCFGFDLRYPIKIVQQLDGNLFNQNLEHCVKWCYFFPGD